MMMFVDAIGYAAGALTAICFLPQILQTLKTRSASDVSLWMLLLTILSVLLYEVYAALLGLWPVVIMNGVFLLLVAFELILKIRFSGRHSAKQAPNGQSPTTAGSG